MTTDGDTGTRVDVCLMWRAIGRLEAQVDALNVELSESKQRLRERNHQPRRDARANPDPDNGRADWQLYAVMVMGAVLVASIFASRFVGG